MVRLAHDVTQDVIVQLLFWSRGDLAAPQAAIYVLSYIDLQLEKLCFKRRKYCYWFLLVM